MRFCSIFFLGFLLLSPAFAADLPAQDDDPLVRRARAELSRVQELVSTGVLPRARLEQAQNELQDLQDDAAVRNLLFQNDITVEQADGLVDLTQKRIERREKTVDTRYKLLNQGIIAQSELGGSVEALAQAKREHDWAIQRAHWAREMVEIAKNEQEAMRQLGGGKSFGTVEHFTGSNRFDLGQFPSIEKAFQTRFSHPLPVSAMGETQVHRALGFDHRNRVDIALQPDLPEGRWLRSYLTAHNIPFFAFRTAVAHKATGAHIHIGPPSLHYVAQTTRVVSRLSSGGE